MAPARRVLTLVGRLFPDLLLLSVLIATAGVAAWTRVGNLAWDDADYLRRGLSVAREALGRGSLIEAPVGLVDGLMQEQPKPPLLVGWIALMRLLTGPRTDLRPLIVLSSALPFAVLAVSVWSITRRHAGITAARLALLALAASPLSLSYGAQVMVETTLALCVLAVLYTTARALVEPRRGNAAALGVAVGLALLAKLTVALLLPLPALYALGRFGRDPRVWDRRLLAAFVVPLLLIAGPWYARNGREAVRFAFFSSRYHQVAEGRASSTPMGVRIEALAQDVAGIPAIAAGVLALAVPGLRRREGAVDAVLGTFTKLAGLGAMGGVMILLTTPYFATRFLGPIWASLAVCLGVALARREQQGGWRAWRIAMGAGVLGVGVVLSAAGVAAEPRRQTHWETRTLLETLATRQGVTSLANVGNTPDWNVCKTGLINELRENPSGLFVLLDLSRATAEERSRRLGRLDALAVLDAAALPPEITNGAPGLNRAFAETTAALAADPRFERLAVPSDLGLPPMTIYIRREKR